MTVTSLCKRLVKWLKSIHKKSKKGEEKEEEINVIPKNMENTSLSC